MRVRLLLVAVVMLTFLAACGDDSPDSDASDTTAQASGAAGGSGTITIKEFKFSPSPLSAKVGDSVTVTNEDGTNHSVTADDGGFDTDAFSSGSKTIILAKAGSIAYHCKIHASMKGVIQVAS